MTRPDASMSLLVDLMTEPIEPAYAQAAARRADRDRGETSEPSRRGRVPHLATVVVLALIGCVMTVSAQALRPSSDARATIKADLVRRIDERRSAADARVRRLDELTQQIAARRSAALPGPDMAALNATVARLEAVTGAVAVTGPGLVLTIDDADAVAAGQADSRVGTGKVPEGTVLARDIQQLANAVWAAGAEAVDVNGQRLTATAAITMAGRAVVVGYRPLTRPYTLTAIGPPELTSRFTAGAGGEYLAALRDSYQIQGEVTARDSVRVAAGPALTARYARPAAVTSTDPNASVSTSTPPGTPLGGNP